MSRFHVATRKGLFTVEKGKGGWDVAGPEFLAHPVTNVLLDRRDGALYAALNLGHFGVKLAADTTADVISLEAGGAGWIRRVHRCPRSE